eukprot:gene20542-24408_t
MGSAALRYAAVSYNDDSVHQDPEGGGNATVRGKPQRFNGYLSFGVDAMRKSVLLVACFTTLSLLLGGCASSLTGDSYSRDEARRVQTVRMGTIESLRPVKIEVAGGLLGSATEEGLTRTQGVEITVREDDGSMRAYVQAVEENEIFRIGDRVRIMTVDGTSRVTR